MDPSQKDARGYDLSDYRREIMLRQMTPLIHFQYQDEGAYLRASSVKPQLDRFVYWHKKSELKPEWLTGPEGKSLAYKLAIVPSGRVQLKRCWPPEGAHLQAAGRGRQRPVLVDEYTPKSYFAIRMTKDEHIGISYCPAAKVVLESMFPELLKVVEHALPAFFLTHNFGIRGSRGNGSFVVQGDQEMPKDEEAAISNHCLGYAKIGLPAIEDGKCSLEDGLTLSDYANAYMDLLRHSLPKDQRWQFGAIRSKRDHALDNLPVKRLPSPILAKVTEHAIYFEYLGYPSVPVSQDNKSPYKKLKLASETPQANLLKRAIEAYNNRYQQENDTCFKNAKACVMRMQRNDINELTYIEGTPLNGGDHH